ncbi:hypothetical protein C3L33_15337, partial [Rhododendron williamsianum]
MESTEWVFQEGLVIPSVDALSPITFGLCYDSSTNGYKAVMALSPFNPNPSDGKFVMVGNFRRKYWKEVCFPSNTGAVHSGPILNGQIHWFARNTDYVSTHCIIYFDPRVDEFKKVPMPKLPKDRNKFILSWVRSFGWMPLYDSSSPMQNPSMGDGGIRAVPSDPSSCTMVAMAYEESLVSLKTTRGKTRSEVDTTYVEHFLSASPQKMIKGKEDSNGIT